MLVGLLPFLALASTTSALVIDSPPASPSLSSSPFVSASATLKSPNLGGNSPNLPNSGLGAVGSPILPSNGITPSPLGMNSDTLPVPDYSSLDNGDDLPNVPDVSGVPSLPQIPSASAPSIPGGLPAGFGQPALPISTGKSTGDLPNLAPGAGRGSIGTPTFPGGHFGGNKIPNGSGIGYTSFPPLTKGAIPKINTNTNTKTNTNTNGNSKRMTNGERLQLGLGLLPPSRRISAKMSRRSAVASANGDPDSTFGGSGNTLASKGAPKYVMRMRNPNDMSDMGNVILPHDKGNDLLGFSPTPSDPLSFPLPSDSSNPFTITPGTAPASSTGNDGDGGDGDDGDAFSGPHRTLAAVPHRNVKAGNNDLKPGSGNYALLGMASPDQGGLLHLDISALIGSLPSDPTLESPTEALGDPSLLLSHLPTGDPSHLLEVGALANAPGLASATVQGVVGSGGVPADSNEYGSPQNALWTFHPRSSRLLAHFVNSDGNTVPTYFVTGGNGACQHTLCLTGDVAAFQNEQGSDASEVHVLATADL